MIIITLSLVIVNMFLHRLGQKCHLCSGWGRRPRRSKIPDSLFSNIALFKNSFGAVPCVRAEKKDNTDENRCELLTSPAHAPKLTSFYKSTDLKLRSIWDVPYKSVSRVGGQGGRGNPNGSLANRCPIPPCCSLDTFCQYRKYHSRHRIGHKRTKVCARKGNYLLLW